MFFSSGRGGEKKVNAVVPHSGSSPLPEGRGEVRPIVQAYGGRQAQQAHPVVEEAGSGLGGCGLAKRNGLKEARRTANRCQQVLVAILERQGFESQMDQYEFIE